MATVVYDCPRCNAASTTHDVLASKWTDIQYGWRNWAEVYCVCRNCHTGTIYLVAQKQIIDSFRTANHNQIESFIMNFRNDLTNLFDIEGYISIKDRKTADCPEHVPPKIKAIFDEGATCLNVACYNAAGTMFRLCVDLATEPLLPPADQPDGPNAKQRRDLGLRLPWLFEKQLLPEALHNLANCIKEDGNDGAHKGTLKLEDAADLKEFAELLLSRLYTEPHRLKLAAERRDGRRKGKS